MSFSKINGWGMIYRQPWVIAMSLWLPPLLFLLILTVFRSGTPQLLPVGVVDLDHSPESYDVVRKLNASPALDIKYSYMSSSLAAKRLQEGEVAAVLIIPDNFGRDLNLSISPSITAFYNNQYLLSGKYIKSSLVTASMELASEMSFYLKVSHGEEASKILNSGIKTQITSLYNTNMSYALFLGTAILPALWQVIIIAATLMVLTSGLEQRSIPRTFLGRSRALFGLLAPITGAMFFQGILMLFMFHFFLGWMPVGNIFLIFAGLALMVLSVQSMALLIFAIVKDKVESLSISAAYLAPAFAFMGITFPRGDMNFIARFWGDLMPSTHYMELQVAVADHGASLSVAAIPLLSLCAFIVVLPFAINYMPEKINENFLKKAEK